jgi:hypothetical protein
VLGEYHRGRHMNYKRRTRTVVDLGTTVVLIGKPAAHGTRCSGDTFMVRRRLRGQVEHNITR